MSLLAGLLDDVVHAFRQVRRRPGFALVVVVTLGGAMGVSTTLFSVVNSIWFRPWNVTDPDRLFVVRPVVTSDEWQAWADEARSFEGLAAVQQAALNHKLRGRRVLLDYVSAGYFDVLGIPIVRGRGFAADDDRSDGPAAAAVISHRTWEEDFASDPEVVGRSLVVDDVTFTVAGVAAPSFEGTGGRLRKRLWLPLSARRRLALAARRLGEKAGPVRVMVLGRLSPAASLPQAQAELQALHDRHRPDAARSAERVLLTRTDAASQSGPGAQAQATFYTLLLAVLFLTLVACANVANLLLARGQARRGEIAVRLSLGATRARLVRRLLVEALLLALVAGGVGVLISTVLPGHLFASVPWFAELLQLDFRPDGRVLAWALFASALACVVFGLAPALSSTCLSVSQVLKDAHGLSVPSLRTSLPSLQALVSAMALAIAGLVLRSEPQREARLLGRALDGVCLVRAELPREYDAARRALLGAALLDGLRGFADDGVVAAADAEPLPRNPVDSYSLGVSPEYFDVLRLRLVAGRTFQAADAGDRVVIVSDGFARRTWPGESPLGKTLASQNPALAGRQVVGILEDGGPPSLAGAQLVTYVPVPADALNVFLVRGAPERLLGRLGPRAAGLDRALKVDVVSGPTWIAQATPLSALAARVVDEFGAFTLVLAGLGLSSLFQYTIRQRTREIGIRTALGGGRLQVLRAVLGPAAGAFARGLLAGGAGALGAGYVMRRFALPSGVDPLDLTTYTGVAAILALAALAAAYLPARHAMRIQPSEALRYE